MKARSARLSLRSNKSDPRVERWSRTLSALLDGYGHRTNRNALVRRIVRAIDRASHVARREERKATLKRVRAACSEKTATGAPFIVFRVIERAILCGARERGKRK